MFFQKTLKKSAGNPSIPGVLLFFIFLRAVLSSEIVISPSNFCDSVVDNFLFDEIAVQSSKNLKLCHLY